MRRVIFFMIFIGFIFPAHSSSETEKVKVAVIYGDVTYSASGTKYDLEGVRLAVEDLNQHGGLLGRQVELIEFDNHGTAIGSRLAASKAVEAGVTAVIGPHSSSHALAAAPVLQEAGIPMITTWATNPEVTLVGSYIFRVCFTDSFQGMIMADFALQDLNAQTAVVLTCTEEKYSLGLAKIFISRLRQKGGTILWEGDYLRESSDFRVLLEKVKELAPDVIFLPGYHSDSGYIIKQARNMGLTATFLGGDSWSINMYTFGGDTIEGSYYSTHWDPTAPNQRSQEFVKRYEAKYPIDDINFFGLAHDAVFLLADAVNRAKSLDPSMIRDALNATENFPGLTGDITIDENGDPLKPLVISRFENGASVYIKTVKPQLDMEDNGKMLRKRNDEEGE